MTKLIGLSLAVVILIFGCSMQQKEPSAQVYNEPAEVKACDDSVSNFIASLSSQPDFDALRNIYEHFLSQSPNSTPLHREFQSLFDGFDRSDDKIEYYHRLLEQNPGSAMYHYLYGRVATGSEDVLNHFRRAVEIDPKYFWGHFGVASKLLSGTPPDTTGAITEYLKCIEIDNSHPASFEKLANIYDAKKDYANALKFAGFFATTSPDNHRPVILKSEILSAQGDKAGAEAALKSYAELRVDNPQVRRALVELYRNDKRSLDALKYQRELVPLTGKPEDGLFEVAKLFVMAGQSDSAMVTLKDAAAKGYSSYRRLERNPLFDQLKSMEGYPEVLAAIKNEAGNQREKRLATLKGNEEQHKQEALANRLDLAAPQFTYSNLNGEQVSLADFKGKVVVIDFWATWCGPCRMTMPLLQDFVENKPADVVFLSLDVWEDDTTKVRPYLADYGYEFNVLFANNQATDHYQVSGIPTLFVIDRDGVIRYKHIGYDQYADQMLLWQTQSLLSSI